MDVVRNGWPAERRQASPCICGYWNIRDEISGYDGILYRGERIIVPATLRSEMLNRIHESHLGIEMGKRRARDVLFWPGMGSAIEDKVSNCATCQKTRTKRPKEPHDRPVKPWSKVATDLFK